MILRRQLIKLAALAACFPRRAFAGSLIDSYRFGAGTGYTAGTAVFDGTNDYMRLTSSGPTGLADGNKFTCSFWIKFSGGAGTARTILSIATSAATRFEVFRETTNKITVLARTSGGVDCLNAAMATAITDDNVWRHIYICVDLNNSSLRKMYVNGTNNTPTWTTFSNNSINFVAASQLYTVGDDRPLSARLNGALSEFWWDDTYLDSPTSFASGGHPIDLGATGNTPSGTAPVFYFKGNGSGFSVNSGTGGNMTITGSLTTTTPP